MSNQRIVIVTGGTRGIGLAISRKFLNEKNTTVIATYVKTPIESDHPNLIVAPLNISQQSSIDKFFANINHVDVLVNNAGIKKDGLSMMMSESQWDDVLNTNLKGTFLMCQKVLQLMVPQKSGRIINLGSLGGKLCFPGQCNYAASKAGIEALTKTLAKEVAKKGITVNCVAPGFIDTELVQDLAPELLQEYKKQIPMKRFGTSDEVAHAVAFLADKHSSYITGHTLEIAGGI